MKNILCSGGNRLEVNALFLQLTRGCALSCKGCYVKEHASNQAQVLAAEFKSLFKKFFFGKEAWANQITVSIDNLATEQTDSDFIMIDLYNEIINAKRMCSESPPRPEIHFTYHNLDTYKQYQEEGGWYNNYFSVAKALDMMSFSQINAQNQEDLDLLTSLGEHTNINYNHLVPSNANSKNIDKYVEDMTTIGEIVDSIYLVVFKRPIYDKLVQIGDVARMQHDMAYINTLLDRLPKHVRRKVHVDGCLNDVVEHRRTNFGCSSNVSRFQVWPDGSVTGCAYAFNSNGKPGRTADNIMENIREAKQYYDFKERCYLPEVYDLVCQGRGTGGDAMATRQ